MINTPINEPVIIQPWLDRKPKYAVEVNPTSLTFPTGEVGKFSESRPVTIKNTGYAVLQIDKIKISRDYVFSPVGNSSVIRPGEILTIEVMHRPSIEPIQEAATLQVLFGCSIPLLVSVQLTATA